MSIIDQKQAKLKEALTSYIKEGTSEAMMELLITTVRVTKPCSGLIWSEIEEMVDEVMNPIVEEDYSNAIAPVSMIKNGSNI